MIVYVASIAANLQNVIFCKKTQAKITDVHNTCLNTFVNLEWSEGYFKLFKDIKCQFPSVIHVPFHRRIKINRMMKTNCHARLLVLSDVYYSLHPLVNPPELSAKDAKRKEKLLSQLPKGKKGNKSVDL